MHCSSTASIAMRCACDKMMKAVSQQWKWEEINWMMENWIWLCVWEWKSLTRAFVLDWERRANKMTCELQLYRRHWTSRRRVVGDKRSNLVDSIDYWFFLNAKERKKPDTQINAQQNVFICGWEITINDSFLWTSWSSASVAIWEEKSSFVYLFSLCYTWCCCCCVVCCFSSLRPRHTLCINFRHVRFSSLLSMLIFAFLYLSCSPVSERHSTMYKYKYKTIATCSVMQTSNFIMFSFFFCSFL